MRTLLYVHVDVFADRAMLGNGLAVVFADEPLAGDTMLDITREFKQFETIFLSNYKCASVRARIFTMEGELPFAGHPVLGAMAALHERYAPDEAEHAVCFHLMEKDVQVNSVRTEKGYHARMRQGRADFSEPLAMDDVAWLAAAHNLSMDELAQGLPVQVVSTGLPYVLIPVTTDLRSARIVVSDLHERIARYGASYTYLFNPQTLEARTWDNLGLVEDSATGSAAGPVCAYLVRHGRIAEEQEIVIHQGQYAHRPGVLRAYQQHGEIYVSGDVAFFASGTFTL